ncbi:hypothetical protein Hsar01_02175 [Haloferula sargassicola]|uniref:Endonuclease/exonuclease/phosphatase domain-containing protein n=2 Tax=Haloferula sargassicola TaxID=490096 RepID=A0ABP9UNP5_9BACT
MGVLSLPALLTAGERVVIATANLTSGHRQSYREAGDRILQALKPDIVAVQEFNVPDAGGPRAWVDRVFGEDFHFMIEEGDDPIPCGVVSRYPITAAGEWQDPQVPDRDFAWATIDLPGAIDLHVVSVHLHGSGKRASRKKEARVLVGQAAEFPAADYMVLCGDFNATDRDEPAVKVLEQLFSDAQVPLDQNGNSNTNLNRNKPYDWVMPDAELERLHVPLEFAGRTFPHGMVFDSRLWDPPPAPARKEDSAAPMMQHMAVVKAFELPEGKNAGPPSNAAGPDGSAALRRRHAGARISR